MQNSSKKTISNCDKAINAQINDNTSLSNDTPDERNTTPRSNIPGRGMAPQPRTSMPMNNGGIPSPRMPINGRVTPRPGMPMNGGMTPPNGVPMYPLYGYDNSEDLDRDMDYFKQLYPATARQIQREVDSECDKLEYDGSIMFDEYPDRTSLDRIIDRVYDKVKDIDETPQVEAKNIYYSPRRRQNNVARDLITIILLNEMLRRRRRYRSRRRWF